MKTLSNNSNQNRPSTSAPATAEVTVDLVKREIRHRDGQRCTLSTRETALLACLGRKLGTPVSRDEILSQVWQLDPQRTVTRTIDMHISMLRSKLGGARGRDSVLRTVFGVGYMLGDCVMMLSRPPADSPGLTALTS